MRDQKIFTLIIIQIILSNSASDSIHFLYSITKFKLYQKFPKKEEERKQEYMKKLQRLLPQETDYYTDSACSYSLNISALSHF